MANPEQLRMLKQGKDAWNRWRREHPTIRPDLRGIDLRREYLEGINFQDTDLRSSDLTEALLPGADLRRARLEGANLCDSLLERVDFREASLNRANFAGAILIGAKLSTTTATETDFSGAIISDANLENTDFSKSKFVNANVSRADLTDACFDSSELVGAFLSYADLTRASFRGANLHEAKLIGARLIGTDFSNATLTSSALVLATMFETILEGADISGAWIHGISVWNVKLKDATQRDLVITSTHIDDNIITVDNLEIAQFVYLLVHHEKIRDVIDALSTKVVLILGRFTPERKTVLDAMRDELRRRDYIPVIFDFEKPSSRDLTETVSTLAHLSRFVIADITDAKSIPQELQVIVPNLPSVAVQPIISNEDYEYALFEHFKRYPSVLPVHRYKSQEELIAGLSSNVIQPAEDRVKQLRGEITTSP